MSSELNLNTINSGDYADMLRSLYTVKGNKILLDNISNFYNFNKTIQLPMNFLRKYENVIKGSLIQYRIDPSRFYRPESVSYDLYGTTDLWYLILFVNDLKSPLELNYQDILVPNSLYITEVINKLKNIDIVKYTHDDPIMLNRVLLKDINDSSDKIIKEENVFIPANDIEFETDMSEFENPILIMESYKLTRDIYKELNNESSSISSFVNNGFVPDTDITIPFRLNDIESHIMTLNKKLKTNQKYYLLKYYCGDMNLTLINEKLNIKKQILNKEYNELSPTILTYDLREASLSPEYLTRYLILEHEGKIYEPTIIKDNDDQDCYGIVIDNNNKYEIYFDGSAYYIITNPMPNSEGEIEVELLENKPGIQINHSMNEWVFNSTNSPIIHYDFSSDENMYFNEQYYSYNGEYVYTLKYNGQYFNVDNKNNLSYRIDINRDLKSNNNKIDKFSFLGFEFNVKAEMEFSDTLTALQKEEIKSLIDFSPMKITVITDEIDDNGENIKYTFSYPFGPFTMDITQTPDDVYSVDLYTNFLKEKPYLYKFKKIIPIIKNLKTKEKINIKEILVSPYIYFKNVKKINQTYANKFTLTIHCGSLKIFGLSYDDIVEPFKTPEMVDDYLDITMQYDYSIKNTRYEDKEETPYFEPYFLSDEVNLLETLDDSQNLNYIIKNNLTFDPNSVEVITATYDTNPKDPTLPIINWRMSNSYFEKRNNQNSTFKTLYDTNDYHELYLKQYSGKTFSLKDNYILELRLYFYESNNNFSNYPYLNMYENVNNQKTCLHHNFQVLFDFQKDNNKYFYMNFGEPYIQTNESLNKKLLPYLNKNKYLDNFNKNSFIVDTKDNKDDSYISYKRFISYQNGERKPIYLKLDNTYFNIPDGIYKVLPNEGSYTYYPYKYIDYFKIRNYPIKQTKKFSEHYMEQIQKPRNASQYTETTKVVENYIYLKIQKINNKYFISYKFKENDEYQQISYINDFYKPINGGTLGFRFFNSIPYNISILDYQISKKDKKK